MVTDMVEHIVGDDAEVRGLLGVGVDPHSYSPTKSDLQDVVEADIVVYSGLFLEAQMEESIKQRSEPTIAVTGGLNDEQLIHPEGTEAHPDPHVWNDLQLWAQCAEYTAEQLGQADPENAADYNQRAADYVSELTELDAYVKEVIASIPEEQRYLVTAHDAFSYFERAYDIPVRSVQGITTTSEPGTSDINDLVQFLVENRVPAVFVETSVSSRGLDAVREGASAQGWEVSHAVALYSDSMGEPGTYEGTFIGMIDHNATRITQELGGEAPAGGYQGKLE
jgi:manganese/zinc/iron transport system substrate-binding protein